MPEDLQQIWIRLYPADLERADERAEKEGTKRAVVIRDAVTRAFDPANPSVQIDPGSMLEVQALATRQGTTPQSVVRDLVRRALSPDRGIIS